MRLLCATHGHCFDGLASAVVFSRWRKRQSQEIVYRACGYGPKQGRPEAPTDCDAIAVLDYRYAKLDRLHYYFDHHRTAFSEPDSEQHFALLRGKNPRNFVYDGNMSSCTRLLAEHLADEPGFEASGLESLIHWADVVDAARFPSAEAASDTQNPVLRLVSVVEQFGDDAFLTMAVPAIERDGLDAFTTHSLVGARYESIAPHHEQYRSLVRARGQLRGEIAELDLTADSIKAVTKFAIYAEFPSALYSVILAKLSSAIRISIGYNPWSGRPRRHDLGALCARYGGGGHPVVGGISLSLADLERARQIRDEILSELGSAEPPV